MKFLVFLQLLFVLIKLFNIIRLNIKDELNNWMYSYLLVLSCDISLVHYILIFLKNILTCPLVKNFCRGEKCKMFIHVMKYRLYHRQIFQLTKC